MTINCEFMDCESIPPEGNPNPEVLQVYSCLFPSDWFGLNEQGCCSLGGVPNDHTHMPASIGVAKTGLRHMISGTGAESRFANGTIGALMHNKPRRIPEQWRGYIAPAYNNRGHEFWGVDAWCSPGHCLGQPADPDPNIIWRTCFIARNNDWPVTTTNGKLYCAGCFTFRAQYIVDFSSDELKDLHTARAYGREGQCCTYSTANMMVWCAGLIENEVDGYIDRRCVPFGLVNSYLSAQWPMWDWFRLDGSEPVIKEKQPIHEVTNPDDAWRMVDDVDRRIRNLALAWVFGPKGADVGLDQLSSDRRLQASPGTNLNYALNFYAVTWNGRHEIAYGSLPSIVTLVAKLKNVTSEAPFDAEVVIERVRLNATIIPLKITNPPRHAGGYPTFGFQSMYVYVHFVCRIELGVRVPSLPTEAEWFDVPLTILPGQYGRPLPLVLPFRVDSIEYTLPGSGAVAIAPPTFVQWHGMNGPHGRRTDQVFNSGHDDADMGGWKDSFNHGAVRSTCCGVADNMGRRAFEVPGWETRQDTYPEFNDVRRQMEYGGFIKLQLARFQEYC